MRAVRVCENKIGKKKRITVRDNFTYMHGDKALEPILMKFGMRGELADIIISASF